MLGNGDLTQYRNTLTVIPIMAIFGAATAAIVRRPSWLLGFAGWFVLVEGMIGQMKAALPFSAYLSGGAGERDSLLIAAGWAVLAFVGAVIAIRRDLTGD